MATLINAYFTKAKLEQMLQAADKGLAVTISVNDDCNNYQQNVSVFKSLTKDERDAKASKTYYGNGQVIWTDGKVTVAPKKDSAPINNSLPGEPEETLPF